MAAHRWQTAISTEPPANDNWHENLIATFIQLDTYFQTGADVFTIKSGSYSTSGKCPCRYLTVRELLPTPPLPTTQMVSLFSAVAWWLLLSDSLELDLPRPFISTRTIALPYIIDVLQQL